MLGTETLLPPFQCGHPRADGNMKAARGEYCCRTCALDKSRRHRANYDRRRYPPVALGRARREVRALENEAARYGMTELLADPRDA